MVMSLLFGDQIFYDKEKKFRTPQKSLLNLMFTTIRDDETFVNPVFSQKAKIEHLLYSINPIMNIDLNVLSTEASNESKLS